MLPWWPGTFAFAQTLCRDARLTHLCRATVPYPIRIWHCGTGCSVSVPKVILAQLAQVDQPRVNTGENHFGIVAQLVFIDPKSVATREKLVLEMMVLASVPDSQITGFNRFGQPPADRMDLTTNCLGDGSLRGPGLACGVRVIAETMPEAKCAIRPERDRRISHEMATTPTQTIYLSSSSSIRLFDPMVLACCCWWRRQVGRYACWVNCSR